MKTKQVNPMPAFVGTPENPCDFDCEFAYADKFRKFNVIGTLSNMEEASYGSSPSDDTWDEAESYYCQPYDDIFDLCRPRLNKPQVLPNWGWLDNPLLDGFVWKVRCLVFSGAMPDDITTTVCVVEILQGKSISILDLACKGVQKGSQLEDWAIENDVPVIGGDS